MHAPNTTGLNYSKADFQKQPFLNRQDLAVSPGTADSKSSQSQTLAPAQTVQQHRFYPEVHIPDRPDAPLPHRNDLGSSPNRKEDNEEEDEEYKDLTYSEKLLLNLEKSKNMFPNKFSGTATTLKDQPKSNYSSPRNENGLQVPQPAAAHRRKTGIERERELALQNYMIDLKVKQRHGSPKTNSNRPKSNQMTFYNHYKEQLAADPVANDADQAMNIYLHSQPSPPPPSHFQPAIKHNSPSNLQPQSQYPEQQGGYVDHRKLVSDASKPANPASQSALLPLSKSYHPVGGYTLVGPGGAQTTGQNNLPSLATMNEDLKMLAKGRSYAGSRR
jgi:hypothetical protein